MDEEFKKKINKHYKAFKVNDQNNVQELNAEKFVENFNRICKKTEDPIHRLETEIIQLLDQLFEKTKCHNVIVDGEEIEPNIGYRLQKEYFSYINGHILMMRDGEMYRSVTIENNELVVQEELIIKDGKIQQAGMNMFNLGFQKSTPTQQENFQEHLHHIREMLSQAVNRRLK